MRIQGEVLDNGGFDPFRDLLANPGARPNDLEKVNLRALSPLQRALLAIDGTVTKFLEAYVLEPVEVIRLKQETVELASDHASLEAPHGTEVVARQVLLHGRYSGAYLLVGGGPYVWEEAIESLVNPRQSEMEQMIESHFAPAHTHPFEALLDQPFTGTF